MNTHLLKLLALSAAIVICSDVFSDEPEKFYTVTKSVKDTSLQDSAAIVVFTFTDQQNNPVNKSVLLSYNGTLNLKNPETNGNIRVNLQPGKYVFTFMYKKDDRDQYFSTGDYVLRTDSVMINPKSHSEIKVNLGNVTDEEFRPVVKKPVIYFYPEKTTPVNVKLNFSGTLNFTYPAYNNGWNFTADTDGTIHLNDKKYSYLFWDGTSDKFPGLFNYNEGFIVPADQLVTFFEDKLTQMGLNAREQQDFITFWCPLMADNEYSYIHFMFNQSCNNLASLTITPQPEQVFRVYMLWSELPGNQMLQPVPQTIPVLKREGFYVVEWGGAELAPSSLFPITHR